MNEKEPVFDEEAGKEKMNEEKINEEKMKERKTDEEIMEETEVPAQRGKAKKVLLEIKNVKKFFPIQRGFFKRTVGSVRAVDGVSLKVNPGEVLGLVGESGCGKSTMGRCILKLLDLTEGEITLQTGRDDRLAIHCLKRSDIKAFRRNVQMIFQDPFSSLNPRMTVYDILKEPLILLGDEEEKKDIRGKIEEIITQVGLKREHLSRYPHSFSGGQRQRIGLARALVLRPRLIIADEPVSALDVSIQAQILNILKELQEKYSLTYIFITHDLAVVRYICDRIAVMYLGNIVEVGEKEELLSAPCHPYTEALLKAVPKGDGSLVTSGRILSGELPDPSNVPPGCVFHPRCPYKQPVCSQKVPEMVRMGEGHHVKCHFTGCPQDAERLEVQ